MPNNQYDRYEGVPSQQEVRQRRELRDKRRKKRMTQRIILFAALAVAAALVIFCIVMILRAVFAEKKPAPGASSPGTSQASGAEPASGVSGADSVAQPGVDHPVAVDNSVWNLVLVNGQKPLPAGHSIPEAELASVAYSGVAYYYDARIGNELSEMIRVCNEATGGSLRVVSAYRGEKNQNERYNYLVNAYKAQGMNDADAMAKANMLEPAAGYSEHQTGLAFDFAVGSATAADDSFATTAEFAWLVENAANYGFILRYTEEKSAITGMAYQPYHFRFVGVEDAKGIKAAGICLEEYLAATSPTGDTGGAGEGGDA